MADDRAWYDYSPLPGRNDWLRACMEDRLPLLYFLQVKPKPGVEYLVFAPVEVIADDADREEARPDPELVAHRWEAAREG